MDAGPSGPEVSAMSVTEGQNICPRRDRDASPSNATMETYGCRRGRGDLRAPMRGPHDLAVRLAAGPRSDGWRRRPGARRARLTAKLGPRSGPVGVESLIWTPMTGRLCC